MGFRVGAVVSVLWMLCIIGIGGAQANAGATQDSSQPPSYTWWDRSLDKPAPPRPKNLDKSLWSYRARVLSSRYEDNFTFLHKTAFTKDPFVWGYIAPFAERFHMPETWIEPELDGALGVAFRMMPPLTVQCGFGGDPKACSALPRCQMDVYYDATIDLPWVHDNQIRDNLMEGMHSGMFLQDPEYQFRSTNQYYRKRPNAYGFPQPGPLASPVIFQLNGQNMTGTVAHFDREYMPGVGLISWFGLCPNTPNPGTATLTFPDANGVPQHVMRFPGSWLQRAHEDWAAQKDEQNVALLTSVLEKDDGGRDGVWQTIKRWLQQVSFPGGSEPSPRSIDSRAYEQNFMQGDGTKPFTADPFTWVYTRAFAARFHMPERWVDPTLKGAQAVAFRMADVGFQTCGLGGVAEACWPRTQCQMDVYFDDQDPLPWAKPFTRDHRKPTLHSGRFLHSSDFRSWGVNRFFYSRTDLDDPDDSETSQVLGSRNSGSLFLYDRAYRPGISLVSWTGHCPQIGRSLITTFSDKDDAWDYVKGRIKREDIRLVHQVVYPEEFWRRANAVYEVAITPVHRTIMEVVEKAPPLVPSR